MCYTFIEQQTGNVESNAALMSLNALEQKDGSLSLINFQLYSEFCLKLILQRDRIKKDKEVLSSMIKSR